MSWVEPTLGVPVNGRSRSAGCNASRRLVAVNDRELAPNNIGDLDEMVVIHPS
jgi:hypothetical protein